MYGSLVSRYVSRYVISDCVYAAIQLVKQNEIIILSGYPELSLCNIELAHVCE